MAKRFNYKKTTEEIKKRQSMLSKEEEKVKCACPHKKDGEMTLSKLKDEKLKYRCYQCGKIIDISAIDVKELENALNIVDRAADIIKLSCQMSKESDVKLAEKTAKTQFRVRNMIKPAFEASINAQNKNINRRNNGGREASSWGKPQSI